MDVKIQESLKKELNDFVKSEYKKTTIYPEQKNIFHAFDLCNFDDIKVVIIGQDPYHGPNQAHGLCFSVPKGVKKPPSLQNIYKEILSDIGTIIPESGNLERWAKQGILLLNAILTVRANEPLSHQNKGWEDFTNDIIKRISDEKSNIVFLLWGAYAQKKAELIDENKHLILKSVHPSPLSAYRGFFGCKHFSKTNKYLKKNGLSEIKW